MYLPSNKSVKAIRHADFRLIKKDRLPGILTLTDGLSRQAPIEFDEDVEKEHANVEAHLVHCLTALHHETPRLALPDAKDDAKLQTSFAEACQYPKWAAAIDRKYNALITRNTWTYVEPTPEMNIIVFLWIFRLKLLDALGLHYMCKGEVLCARGPARAGY